MVQDALGQSWAWPGLRANSEGSWAKKPGIVLSKRWLQTLDACSPVGKIREILAVKRKHMHAYNIKMGEG